MMNCIAYVTYSILLNGEPQHPFVPSRGIAQEDPISPYFFILCAETLSSLINIAEARGIISDVPIGKCPLCINNLLFADDSLLFCKANSLEWSQLTHILELYEKSSRQGLKKDNTSIFFSKNTPKDIQKTIVEIAGFKFTY